MLLRLLVVVLLLVATAAHATDCSGTIITGGTAQTVFTSSNVRRLVVMNKSANLMCISWNGSAASIAGTNCAAGSWPLQPGSSTTAGGSFYTDGSGISISVLSIISSATGDRFSCERQ